MLDPITKKTKNLLEKQLKATRKREERETAKKYSLLCQIYKLKGRCFSCEKNAALPPGECKNLTPECLRQGLK